MYSKALPYKDYNEGREIIGKNMSRDNLDLIRQLKVWEKDIVVINYIKICKDLRRNWIYVDELVKINREGNENIIKQRTFDKGMAKLKGLATKFHPAFKLISSNSSEVLLEVPAPVSITFPASLTMSQNALPDLIGEGVGNSSYS